MQTRDEIKADDILATVSEILSSPQGLANERPIVLSCGGIYLRGRQIPKGLGSERISLFLPNAGVRVYRMKGETSAEPFQRILAGESLN